MHCKERQKTQHPVIKQSPQLNQQAKNNHCYQARWFPFAIPQGKDENKCYLIKPHKHLPPPIQTLLLKIKWDHVFKPRIARWMLSQFRECSIVRSGLAITNTQHLSRKNTKSPIHRHVHQRPPSLSSSSRWWPWDHLLPRVRQPTDGGCGQVCWI